MTTSEKTKTRESRIRSNSPWAGLHYKVWHFVPESPLHLQGWLEKKYEEEKIELVSVCDGCYFIFKVIDGVKKEK